MSQTHTQSGIAVVLTADPQADVTNLLVNHIAKTVAEWPDLPSEKLDRLALLLRGGGARV